MSIKTHRIFLASSFRYFNFVERKRRAEWKYNPERLIKKVVRTVVVTSAIIGLLSRKHKRQAQNQSEAIHRVLTTL